MDITSLPKTDIEALAYNQVKQRDNAIKNLEVIEAELARRAMLQPNSPTATLETAQLAPDPAVPEEVAPPAPAPEPAEATLGRAPLA